MAATSVPRLIAPVMTRWPPMYSVKAMASASSNVKSGKLKASFAATVIRAWAKASAALAKPSICWRSRAKALTTRIPARLSCKATVRSAVFSCTHTCKGRSSRPTPRMTPRKNGRLTSARPSRRPSSQAIATIVPVPARATLSPVGQPNWKKRRTASTSAVARDMSSPVWARS